MLDTAVMWASVHGWLTPTVLFLLLNLVIGTIVVTSSRIGAEAHHSSDPGDHKLSRSPSLLLDRLRSLNLSSYRFTAQNSPTAAIEPETQNHIVPEPEPEPTTATEEPGPEEQHHITRSQSDTKPVAGEMPEKLPKKMKKSATMKSAFNHFEIESGDDDNDQETEIAKQRPATMRELREREEEEEFDARADDFINRFKQQLKLQRMDSIIRYKEMINRGN